MNKNYINNPSDLRTEGQEHSKKLYRSISENVRRLDDARSCARSIGDLFAPPLQILRSKFRDYCERLIFSNPLLYGRKAEELLWRKGFYEVISTAKRLKKQEYTLQEKCNIQAHINSGIGYYHHYLSRLQQEYDYTFEEGLIDFPLTIFENNLSIKKRDKEINDWLLQSMHKTLVYLGDLCRYKLEIYPNWDINLAVRYYSQAIYLQPDFGMPHNQMGTLANNFNLNHSLDAVYHYIRCLSCKNVFEGTENNLHRIFEKNAQFIENLSTQEGSKAKEDEIKPIPSEHIKRFISRFLLLTDIWFFSKKVPHIYHLCHQINSDLRDCLTYLKPVSSEIGDNDLNEKTDNDNNSEPDSLTSPPYLNSDILFKIAVICLLCISKLQLKNQSHQLSNVVAFSLALYSQIIQNVIQRIQESILNLPIPAENENNTEEKSKKKKRKKKLRRRRIKIKINPQEEDSEDEDLLSDSDLSLDDEEEDDDDDEEVEEDDEEEEEEIFDSDAESLNSSSSDLKTKQAEVEISTLNGGVSSSTSSPSLNCHNNNINNNNLTEKTKEELIELSRRLDVNDMLEIVFEEHLLQAIKILSNWLQYDVDVLKSCGKTTRSLFNQIVHLINLINININVDVGGGSKLLQGIGTDVDLLKEHFDKLALPEDVVLKGMDILASAQKKLDWGFTRIKTLTPKEETVVRILKFVEFGHYLVSIPESGVTYDQKTRMFSVSSLVIEEEPASTSPLLIDDVENIEAEDGLKKIEEKGGGKLSKMKHMGQLWLAAEVRELENRVSGKAALSPYLVIDVECLIKYTAMVRQLVFSRKFIVLVPTSVVSALDELKREHLEAREAIRWLESQFHHGNRFFRAQRPQERLPLPFIKYPKKKDKDAIIFIQIIECCHYLSEQQKGASGLVTLLIGNAAVLNGQQQSKDMSYVGLAHSAGVNIELITEFYAKWKKTQVKGKR